MKVQEMIEAVVEGESPRRVVNDIIEAKNPKLSKDEKEAFEYYYFLSSKGSGFESKIKNLGDLKYEGEQLADRVGFKNAGASYKKAKGELKKFKAGESSGSINRFRMLMSKIGHYKPDNPMYLKP